MIGQEFTELTLSPPVFFYGDMSYEDEAIYVGRVGELPAPPEGISCLIVVVGGHLPPDWNPRNSCAFILPNVTDLLWIFNLIQNVFCRYNAWNETLLHILETTADLDDMIKLTSDFLAKPIVLINNQLEIISVASSDRNPGISILNHKGVASWVDTHDHNITLRDPFYFNLEGRFSYCINVFLHHTYWGMVSLGDVQPTNNLCDTIIFQYFFRYLLKAIEKNDHYRNSKLLTPKTIFTDLLNYMPVGDSTLERVCGITGSESESWYCVAIRPVGAMKKLPWEYFCRELEWRLRKSIAICFDPFIVLFLSQNKLPSMSGNSLEKLEGALAEMNLRGGVSMMFYDLRDVRTHFQQATIALELGDRLEPARMTHYFENHALYYALKNSIGELRPENMLTEELRAIKERVDGVDYWTTLRVYLDNEMNVTQTARDLFIHRTTLQARLQRIQSTIDLSKPEQRLYIRYCLYMDDLFQKL